MKPSLPSFLALDVPPAPPDQARFEIIPVPLEHSASYGRGTAAGPAKLLEASLQLEAYDGEGVPAYAGIYTGPAVDCEADTASVLQQIEARVATALAGGRVPIVIGGEHTVALGAVRAFAARGEPFGVVQFDAHADLRDLYEGNPFSHACVMRRIVELNVPIFQVGVRSLSVGEAGFRQLRAIPFCDAEELARPNPPRLALPSDFPARVYITFDVDAFDPAPARPSRAGSSGTMRCACSTTCWTAGAWSASTSRSLPPSPAATSPSSPPPSSSTASCDFPCRKIVEGGRQQGGSLIAELPCRSRSVKKVVCFMWWLLCTSLVWLCSCSHGKPVVTKWRADITNDVQWVEIRPFVIGARGNAETFFKNGGSYES